MFRIINHIKETVIMATKECPYCHNQIADEAILCKFCHNLLIGNNQDIESASIASRERAKKRNAMRASSAVDQALGRTVQTPRSEEDLTREFSSADAAELQERTRSFSVPKQPVQPRPAPQPKRPEPQPIIQPEERYDDAPYYEGGGNGGYYDYDNGYYEDTYDQSYDYDNYPDHPQDLRADDDRYYERDYYDEDDEDYEESKKKKKIFLITALITFSVIAVVLLAIFVGYKLVGFARGDSSSKSAVIKPSSITTASKITSESSVTTTKKQESETTQDTEITDDTESVPQTTDQESPTQSETQSQTSSETQSSGDSQTQQSQSQQSQTQQSQSQQPGTIDQAQVLANVASALASQNSSGIKSYEYRTEDDGTIYLYVYTNDDHAYSVAYFKGSGQCKIVQAW